jgi:hypothetical protein
MLRQSNLLVNMIEGQWANLASHNAGVTVVIVGISNRVGKVRNLFAIAMTTQQTSSKKSVNRASKGTK